MEYISVIWKHQNNHCPVRLVSELDADRMERRKLEFFADGSIGIASGTYEGQLTRLGTVAVPLLAEINADPQFEGALITQGEFDSLWREHVPVA
jgi:hypothetical protein